LLDSADGVKKGKPGIKKGVRGAHFPLPSLCSLNPFRRCFVDSSAVFGFVYQKPTYYTSTARISLRLQSRVST
jgi:hypothetical protein